MKKIIFASVLTISLLTTAFALIPTTHSSNTVIASVQRTDPPGL